LRPLSDTIRTRNYCKYFPRVNNFHLYSRLIPLIPLQFALTAQSLPLNPSAYPPSWSATPPSIHLIRWPSTMSQPSTPSTTITHTISHLRRQPSVAGPKIYHFKILRQYVVIPESQHDTFFYRNSRKSIILWLRYCNHKFYPWYYICLRFISKP
jgi:hypothetical protein